MSKNLESSEIQFRDATEKDIPALLEFLGPFFDAHILRRTEVELRVLVRHGFVALTAANASERIVGFAAVEIYSPKLAEIQSLAVSPDFQRRGIGRNLVGLCVERAKREGVLELMAITVTEKLFRDNGFDYSLPNQRRAVFLQTGKPRESNE